MKSSKLKQLIKEEFAKILISENKKLFPNFNINEIMVNTPARGLGGPLNIQIGKYDVSKGRRGKMVNFNSKDVSTPTRKKVLAVFDKLGIKPEKTWVGYLTKTNPDGTIDKASLKSTFVLSHYKDEPILIAQTQTSHPASGQIYIYSKYFKSGKGLRLPDGTGRDKDSTGLFADTNATKEEILQALNIDL